MSEDKILAKIKKLMNMERSAREIGNEQEAMAFAARVQQMLHNYKMEMSEVEEFDLDSDDMIEVDSEIFTWEEAGIPQTKKQSHWLLILANVVSKYNNCRAHGYVKSNKIAIIGTESSRAVVSWLLVTLARFGKDSLERCYRKQYYEMKKIDEEQSELCGYEVNYNRQEMKGFRRAFLSAYVMSVEERLRKQWEEDQAKTCSERGLTILDKEKEAVEEFYKNIDLRTTHFRGASNEIGAEEGYATGKRATIQCNGVRGTRQKTIE